MTDRPDRPRPRRPGFLDPAAADELEGGPDPAARMEAAHATAEALVRHGRSGDDVIAARILALADDGIDEVADLWAAMPAESLPGALWRIHALRAGIRGRPVSISRAFDAGRHHAPVHEVVAGVAEPPGPAEVVAVADAILTGAFTGDLAVALERAAAFCRVLSTGLAALVEDGAARPAGAVPPGPGPGPRRRRRRDGTGPVPTAPPALPADLRRAGDLQRTASQLEAAARRWRDGTLH